jgi:hypothetical protein
LSVNAQIVQDCELRIYNLGNIELLEVHTGVYIKQSVEKVLGKYDKDLTHVHSVTSDNAKKMVTCVETNNQVAMKRRASI